MWGLHPQVDDTTGRAQTTPLHQVRAARPQTVPSSVVLLLAAWLKSIVPFDDMKCRAAHAGCLASYISLPCLTPHAEQA